MLERYLINTLQNHENDFSEALDPNWNDASKSFMGENELMKPAMAHEVRSLTTSIVDAIKACAVIVLPSGISRPGWWHRHPTHD